MFLSLLCFPNMLDPMAEIVFYLFFYNFWTSNYFITLIILANKSNKISNKIEIMHIVASFLGLIWKEALVPILSKLRTGQIVSY